MAPGTEHSLARSCATLIRDGFDEYNEAFREMTRRARTRFEQRDWLGGRRDAIERIDLYDRCAAKTVEQLDQLLGRDLLERELWERAKELFTPLADDRQDPEFAKTYFSSVTRRIFRTAGIDTDIEFVGDETAPLRNVGDPVACRNYVHDGSLRGLFERVLRDYSWSVPYGDLETSAHEIAHAVGDHYRDYQDRDAILCVDILDVVFYRDTRAYLIGQITGWTRKTPLVIALQNTDGGIRVDAVIQEDRGISRLFGFARSYFHADLDRVGATILFLRKLMPRRPINELFTVLGRAKQGKTDRFRDLSAHLRHSHDQFIFAPGEKGLVMLVFTLPSYDVVFKVIRDEFLPPKQTTRDQVMERYDLVFKHDKAGRLVDTQEFHLLKFDRHRFSPDLLEELLACAPRSIRIEGDEVVVGHAYIERRLRPLNLYLNEVSHESAKRAVLDYGHAIRDLARSNVFPGDLLLKNFGVSYHGRVLFYDYDEICLLTDCNFRTLPTPRTHEEEMSAEPWFYVGANDVFPQEFAPFLGFGGELKELFLAQHADLLTPEFWTGVQNEIRSGNLPEVLPY